MSKVSFVLEYWDWLKDNNYKPEDAGRRDLLHNFYHTEFHKRHPQYSVNGVEYFQALGVII